MVICKQDISSAKNNLCSSVLMMMCVVIADLEWWLVENGIVTTSELHVNPRSEDEDGSSSPKKGFVGKYAKGRRAAHDSDSDGDAAADSD